MLDEYAGELAINGLPHPKADIEAYRLLDKSDIFHVIAAFDGNLLAGFISIVVSNNPHYGQIFAASESFFVRSDYRNTGAGLKLLRQAENLADSLGSPALFVSAPYGKTLAEVLPHCGYKESNRVFFKAFGVKKIAPMSDEAIAKVQKLEDFVLKAPQLDIPTAHTLHGGVYTRTIVIPKNVILTGALIKIATTLISDGDVTVYVGDSSKRLTGYHVITASAHRKQAFVAHEDTRLTMLFSTNAQTIEDAENEFTNDVGLLMSNNGSGNQFLITGEKHVG